MRFSVVLVLISFAVVGASHASARLRKIEILEEGICEPRKRHLDEDGNRHCICDASGYRSLCDEYRSLCDDYICEPYRRRKRDIEDRECTPFREFGTQCHYCKCSPIGYPDECVEKHPGCMDDLLSEMELDEVEYDRRTYNEDGDTDVDYQQERYFLRPEKK